jgi:hypothetical protein
MRLDSLQIEILRAVRQRLEVERRSTCAYICIAIEEEISDREINESNLWRNRIMFWRRLEIFEKWAERSRVLRSAVHYGIGRGCSVGAWFDSEASRKGVNIETYTVNNLGLYKQIRLAWLDRMIYTGELK